MLDKKYLEKARNGIHDYSLVRRDVIKYSGDALHHAKRAIFAMHRDNMKEAEKKMKESEKLLKNLIKKYKKTIVREGSFRAGVEEYVEAVLFHQFLTVGKIGKINSIPIDPEVYIAGLADVPGELYRYAIKAATNKDVNMVEKCAEAGQEIIGELIEFNLTSYLRNKFDQAKSARNKLELVRYELSLRE